MKRCLLKVQAAAMLAAVLAVAGCSRTINVMATDDICKKSVEVHLVGVSKIEKATWETISMTDYWKPDSPLRKSAKDYTLIIKFGSGPCEQTVAANHPIRKKWKANNAAYIFVLAQLPGLFSDLPGNADARRLGLPAPDSVTAWDPRDRQIKISIESGQIRTLTIPRK